MAKFSATALPLILRAAGADAAPRDCMNNDPQWWRGSPQSEALYNRLVGMLSCPTDDPASGRLADRVACNYVVGRALNEIYGISDFSTGPGSWLTANHIAEFVESNSQWSSLGSANDQAVLDNAAQGAANGQPVIAVQRGSPGHVVLILPGEPKPSSTWRDSAGRSLRTPNSAAFSLDNINGAYVFCPPILWLFQPGECEDLLAAPKVSG